MQHIVRGGKSYSALADGLQTTLHKLGGVPTEHRTDSSYERVTQLNLATIKGYLMREDFQRFWIYQCQTLPKTY